MLFSPALTGDYDDPRRAVLDRSDAMLDLRGLEPLARRYAGDLAHDDPRLAPLSSSLTGLPPIALFASKSEILWLDALALHKKAAEDGVDLEFHGYDDMVHAWPIFPIPEGVQAVDAACAFVRDREL